MPQSYVPIYLRRSPTTANHAVQLSQLFCLSASLSSQNIGYVIPVPIIKHFLADTDPQDGPNTARTASKAASHLLLTHDDDNDDHEDDLPLQRSPHPKAERRLSSCSALVIHHEVRSKSLHKHHVEPNIFCVLETY